MFLVACAGSDLDPRYLAQLEMARASAAARPSAEPVAAEPVPELPALAAAKAPSAAPYRIRPYDRITIAFPYDPSLDQNLVVRPDGRLSLPWLPDFKVQGLTSRELERDLRFYLADHLRDPDPRVVVRALGPRRVTVVGDVRVPGLVALADARSVFSAIAAAGGPTPYSRLDQVLVIRPETEGGPAIIPVNLRGLSAAGGGGDLELQPNDVVYVPSGPREGPRTSRASTPTRGIQ